MKIINLTPHAINLYDVNGNITTIEPSGSVARVDSTNGELIGLAGIPCATYEAPVWGDIEGLPPPTDDTIYIVSSLVASRIMDRDDVFSPGTGPKDEAIRDEKGRIIGVTRLIQSPVLFKDEWHNPWNDIVKEEKLSRLPWDDIKCPRCGNSLYRDIQIREIEFKGEKIAFEQPGWYCGTCTCKDGVLDPRDIKYWDNAMLELNARLNNKKKS